MTINEVIKELSNIVDYDPAEGETELMIVVKTEHLLGTGDVLKIKTIDYSSILGARFLDAWPRFED
jgi:hypothetical protein